MDLLTYAGNPENLRDVEDNPRYRFVHADIRDREATARLFAGQRIDAVINLAAQTHVDRSIADASPFLSTNAGGTLCLLDCAREAWQTGDGRYREGVRFLQVSTDEVYGSLGSSGFFTETSPLDPHSPYAASKASADLFVRAYADTYRLPVLITRCSNNYGPCQHPEKLIPRMIGQALRHQPLPVYGDGLQVRDWLHVEDHVRALDMVLHGGTPGEIYNIGGHNELTNLELIRTLLARMRELGAPADESLITHVADRKGHDRRYGIDPSKIRNALGWRPEIPFAGGIRQTVQWYLAHPDRLEPGNPQ